MKDLRRIALFGGTFDPIHIGHTTVAGYTALRLDVDALILIPASQSPLKSPSPRASGKDRLNMIQLAISGHPTWQASDCELTRSAPSYTIDTIHHFRGIYGKDAMIYWLIGADCASELAGWHQIEQLLAECIIVTMTRPGWPRPDFRILQNLLPSQGIRVLQEHIIKTPSVDISSSTIRQRIASGMDVKDMLHPAVLGYIRQHRLYTNP